MKIHEILETVDTHTGGEPTRIILSGIPTLKGNSVKEKRDYFKKKYDYIRTRLTYEPRGHAGMLCAAIVPPCHGDAHFGVFYFDDVQYLDMCGHATIGVGTALAEIGLADKENREEFILETPAGLVKVKNNYKDGNVKSTSIVNVDSFVVEEDYIINLKDIGDVTIDIAYGGNYFAIVPADKFNVKIVPESIDNIKYWSNEIRQTLNKTFEPKGIHVNLIQWYHQPISSDADLRVVHSSGAGSPDRSPGGTGTGAKLAVLYSKNQLDINQDFVHESIIGTRFIGRILDIRSFDDRTYIKPQITGEAYITGFHKFVFNESDQLKDGFYFEK